MIKAWLPIPADSDFSIHNLPFGIYSAGHSPRAGVAIGDQIVDLTATASLGLFPDVDPAVFMHPTLNPFIALGKPVTTAVRRQLQAALSDENTVLKEASQAFVKQSDATMHMPVTVGDYTDFYSSIEHATNVGKMFRDPANALLPNWRHIPVGYHGRASSIIASGTPIHRPKGQVMPKDASTPVYQASGRLDFELEMGFIIGKQTALGTSISTADAEDHIFGLVLFNDWSARDIQKWEYVPLGPFLGKSFASSMSPWIVTLEALDAFRQKGPAQEPRVLPYLQYEGDKNFDVNLEVSITPPEAEESVISHSNFKYMYWNMAQQLA
ncbi:MAG: fumarylacetoacetase, partial [Rhodothermales bacterium]